LCSGWSVWIVNVAGPCACAAATLNNAATPNPIANFTIRIIARFSLEENNTSIKIEAAYAGGKCQLEPD
jgi:hypothetical protein